MSNHTPGPWHVPDGTYDTHVSDADGLHLATLIGDRSREEQSANARLIAAAPELLEACWLAINTLHARNYQGDVAVNRIKATIAKAEGTS